MKSNLLRKTISIMLSVMVIFSLSSVCFAAGGSVSFGNSKSSAVIGETYVLYVELSAEATGLSGLQFGVEYDSSAFTYSKSELLYDKSYGVATASGNQIQMFWFSTSTANLPLAGATKIIAVYFTPIKAGSATFRISSVDGFVDQDGGELSVSPGATKTVEITAPVPKSDNNNLKSLNVDPGTISPAFAAGTLKYAMTVAEGLSKITVSAAPADAKASVTITGHTKLVDGANTIKITVTAENGSKKTYTIIATRAGPTPTPMATPTPAVTLTLPGGLYTVLDLPPDMVPPVGFTPSTITLNAQTVQIYQAAQGDLNLFYLAAADGTPGLFYYNKSTDSYLPFVVMTIPAQLFTILTPDSGVTVPAGFFETTLLLNGQSVIAWQRTAVTPVPTSATTADTTLATTTTTTATTTQTLSTETTNTLSTIEPTSTAAPASGEYLLYLMDSSGAKNFYLYNAATMALSQYQAAETIETTETTAGSENTETTESTSPGVNPIGEDFNIWQLFSLVLGLICLVLIGMVIWLVVRGPGGVRKEKLPPEKKPSIRRVD